MAGDVVSVAPNGVMMRLMDPGLAAAAMTPAAQVEQARANLAAAQRAADAAKMAAASPSAAGCCGPTPWQTISRAHVKAHAFAGAMISAYEGERPNCWVSLLTTTPAVAVASGAATGTLTVSLPAKTQICEMLSNDTNAEDFLCTSLQFNSWEGNKGGGGATMAIFKAALERHNMLLPLVGFFWKGTVTISGNFTNLNASGKIFSGLTILCYNGECLFAGDELLTEQGFEVWGETSQRAIAHGLQMGLLLS